GASMPYMREFFHEKLQLPIEFFHPLRNVSVAETARATEIAQASHLLGELVGLALRSGTTCPMELNLRTSSVTRAHDLTRRRPFFILAAACFLLGLIGWGFYYVRAASVTRQATENVTRKVDGMQRLATQMDAVRRDTTALDAVATPLTAAVNDRSFWVEIIEDLNARLPKENIWITELVATSGGKPIGVELKSGRTEPTSVPTPTPRPLPVAPGARTKPAELAIDGIFVRGLYLYNPKQQEVVVDYFRELVKSPFFAIDPNNQAKVIKPTTPTNTEWAFPYELRLELKKPVPLPLP
ncbi:MAG: hypothetical protein ABI992_06015, partial [Chthoniobacterales bacterium]